MTRPPNPKSAKVRKIKVWVWAGTPHVLRKNGQCVMFRTMPRMLRAGMVRATLLLPTKAAKGKA